MSLIGWAIVGLLAGGLARRVVGADARGCVGTMVVGLVGAFIGGGLYRWYRGSEVQVFDEFDLFSIGVAFVGAVLLLFVLQAVEGRNAPRRPIGRR
jgi:uncharacterized membrane protein YeaQ/YmgE (transglycosylase-associated protein family)